MSDPPQRNARFRPALVAGLAVAIAVLAWPLPFKLPLSDYFVWGLDFSWQIALHLAAVRKLQWGSELLFTYGPLGFLCVPVVGRLVSANTSALGLAFVAAIMTALAAVLLLSLRRWLPLPVACLAALLGAMLLGGSIPEAGAFAGLLLVGLALGGELGPRPTSLAPAMVAALAALLLLVKASAGIALAAVVPLAVMAERDGVLRRGLGAVAAFAAVLTAAWMGAGQSLDGFPGWLAGALRMASGYTEAMAAEEPARRWEYPALAIQAVAFALVFAAGVLLASTRGMAPAQILDSATRASALLHEIGAVARPQARRAIELAARTGIRRSANLPPQVLAVLQPRRVQVDPHDVAILWAYGLDWSPVPVFQAYAAYSPALDRMNARRLEDPSGPDAILRRRLDESIDGKSPVWETPEYALARLCRFRESVANDLWQVLVRSGDRCGPEQPLGTVSAPPGVLVAVPPPRAPDRIVVARLDAAPSLAERLRTLLFKPRGALALRVGERRWRLVRANLAGPLLLRIPPTSGWSPAFDGTLAVESFAVEGAGTPVAVRFAEIPLAAAPPP